MEPVSKTKALAGGVAGLVGLAALAGTLLTGKAAPQAPLLPVVTSLCRQADAAKAHGEPATARRLYVACLQADPRGPDAQVARRGLEAIPDMDP